MNIKIGKFKVLGVALALCLASTGKAYYMSAPCVVTHYVGYLANREICKTFNVMDKTLCWTSSVKSAMTGDFTAKDRSECFEEANEEEQDCMLEAAVDFNIDVMDDCIVE